MCPPRQFRPASASAADPPRQKTITVQVAYVSDARVAHVETVSLHPGQSVRDAIRRSGLPARCPEIDLDTHRVGIFGHLCTLDSIPADGDRVEIYRGLRVDPKEARRRRARRDGAQQKTAAPRKQPPAS